MPEPDGVDQVDLRSAGRPDGLEGGQETAATLSVVSTSTGAPSSSPPSRPSCSVEGCDRATQKNGTLCAMHYKRQSRAGTGPRPRRAAPPPPPPNVPYTLRLPADLIEWVEAQGGRHYVRGVLECVRELEQAPTVPVTFAGAFRPLKGHRAPDERRKR